MPRKLFFKETNETVTPPSGYVSFGIGGDGKILTTNDQNQTTPGNDTTFDCFISSSQSYMIGTWSVYPHTWDRGFKYKDNYFHLVHMKSVQNPLDFFDTYSMIIGSASKNFWGLYKENSTTFEFMGGWNPIESLGLDLKDYIQEHKKLSSISIYATGSGYTSSTNVDLTGGSGTGAKVDISAGKVLYVDFEDVSPETNSFPIAGYANSTITFNQSSTSGSGVGIQFNLTFDSSGNPQSVSITNEGLGYDVNEIITTDDYGYGSIFVRVTGLGRADLITISSPGEFYEVGDILTLSGGNSDQQFIVDTLENYQTEIYNFFDTYGSKTTTDGIEFTDVALYQYNLTNNFIKYKVQLSDDGNILGFTLSNYRDLNSASSSTIIGLLPGYQQLDQVAGGNSGLVRNVPADYTDSFQDVNKFYLLVENTSTLQRDFLSYDIITNEFTPIMEDLEGWWSTYATGVPWLNESSIAIQFHIVPHSTKPLLVAGRGQDALYGINSYADSYLVEPTRFTKLGTNRMTDDSWNLDLITKNKIYMLSKNLAYPSPAVDSANPDSSEIQYWFRQSTYPEILIIYEYDIPTETIKRTQKVLNFGTANLNSQRQFLSGEKDAIYLTLYDGMILSEDNIEGKWPSCKLKMRYPLTLTGKDSLIGGAYRIGEYFYNMGVIPSPEGGWLVGEKQFII